MDELKASPLDRLVHAFARLPGIGTKTATRLAYHILKAKPDYAANFAAALSELHLKTGFCRICQNFSETEICEFCQDQKRDVHLLLVVESPEDLLAIEKVGEFKGHYHILHGALSPLNGIGPDDLKIKELLKRLADQPVQEVILAMNSNVEGEATCLYLSKLLKPMQIAVTRLSTGIPVGGGIEYLDPLTLQRAIEARVPF